MTLYEPNIIFDMDPPENADSNRNFNKEEWSLGLTMPHENSNNITSLIYWETIRDAVEEAAIYRYVRIAGQWQSFEQSSINLLEDDFYQNVVYHELVHALGVQHPSIFKPGVGPDEGIMDYNILATHMGSAFIGLTPKQLSVMRNATIPANVRP